MNNPAPFRCGTTWNDSTTKKKPGFSKGETRLVRCLSAELTSVTCNEDDASGDDQRTRRLNHTMFYGELDQAGRVLNADLIHDIAAMHFYRAHADLQPFGNERIRVAVGD